ncbi:hypothetical protein [Natroniella acetigena]|uniref:hypothetical protein n=1 Tax=Natroniella acetigena TaxID=52004 RepID=UPI00200A3D2D|nr:hypothetical protein [Natroniella acetigena]
MKESNIFWLINKISSYNYISNAIISIERVAKLNEDNYEEIILDWFEENITSQKLRLMLESLTSGDIETFAGVFRG